jgi:pyrophosphatase PpaX
VSLGLETNRSESSAALGGRRVRAVLFDVDGTLVDSIPFLVECFQHSARATLGLRLDAADVLPLVGMPLADMYRALHSELDDVTAERCIAVYREVYYPSVTERSPLFPDTLAVIDDLAARGLALGVVSGKNALGIRRVLEPSGLVERFRAIVGADHGGPGKPAPDHAIAAARRLGVSADEVVVVGDSLLDVDMGTAAGMATIGVATGTTARSILEVRASAVVDRLSELLTLLETVDASRTPRVPPD